MNSVRRHPPNQHLAWERLERGWSHDELCAQIKHCMREAGEPDTGLTANTVRRWESGERLPEPRFRKHLVLIFGQPASELGLLTRDEQAARPARKESLDELERLLTMLGDQAARHGISRQRFLSALGAGAASALGLGEAFETLHRVQRGARVDPRVVDSYRAIAGRHRELYWTTPAAVLLPASLGHTQLGVELLSSDAGNERQALAGAVAESALLGARLAFFDQQQPHLAERCFDIATAAVRESGDHALAAAVIAHRSFVPCFAGDRAAAQPLLDAALSHVRYGDGPLLRAWLHCVHAEVSARTSDAKHSVQHARQAEDSLTTSGTDPDWLDFFDPARLAGFLGYSQLILGRTGEAVRTLERALAQLDDQAGKQRSVVLFDLAAAHAASDPEQGMAVAEQAFDQLEREPYVTARDRIPALQRSLHGTAQQRALDDRVRALSTVGT